MDVATAGLDQAFDDRSLDRHHVRDEVVEVTVDGARGLIVEALRDPVRPDQRHLEGLRCELADALIFLERNIAPEREARVRGAAMRHRGPDIVHLRDVPALQRRRALHAALVDLERGALGVIALDRGAKTVLEIQPAHLAVADHVEAGTFLQPHRGLDYGILDGPKTGLVDTPLVKIDARVFQVLRTQQAADHVGPDGLEIDHSAPLGPPLEHEAEMGRPTFGQDHAQTRTNTRQTLIHLAQSDQSPGMELCPSSAVSARRRRPCRAPSFAP